MVDELAERFAAVDHPPDDSDWLEVNRLARQRRRRRARPAVAVAAVAVAAATAVLATPAFGVGDTLRRLFESGEPAPATIERSFARLDAGAPPGFRTGVVPADTRKIVVPNRVALWIAPTKSGGFCMFVAGGGGQCDAQRAFAFWPTFSIGGSYTKRGVITGGPVLVDGSTTLEDAASVDVRFEDGDVASVPVVWVSAPIDAGFFGYEVPPSHWAEGHRPTLMVVRDADGHELQRDSSAFRAPEFRRGPSTGLAPCVFRGGGESCLRAAVGDRSRLLQPPTRARPRADRPTWPRPRK
jgi:hypothetical protein